MVDNQDPKDFRIEKNDISATELNLQCLSIVAGMDLLSARIILVDQMLAAALDKTMKACLDKETQ